MATVQAELLLDLSQAQAELDSLSSDIDSATSDVSLSIDVSSTVDEVQSELDSLEAEPVEIDVQADLDAVEAEIEGIGADVGAVEVEVEAPGAAEAEQEVAALGDAADSGASAMEGLGAATGGFSAAAGAAGGSASGLVEIIGGLGPGGAAAAAGIAAVATNATMLFGAAVESTGSVQRFTQVFGSLASEVDSIDLGGVNYSLEEFAVLVGQDDEALRNAITSIGAAGEAFGVGQEQVAGYSEQLTLLAGRTAVLRPGTDIGQSVDQLNRLLATGGGRLARYGLDIGTVAERQEIANEMFGRGFEDLSRFEQSMVGAEAATRNLGSSLQRDIIAGSENVQVKLQALTQTFQNTLETLGEPLILPVFDLLQEAIPIATSLSSVLGSLAQAGVPLVAAYADGVAPAFEALADAAQDLAPEIAEFAPLFGELAAEFGEFGVNAIEAGAGVAELLLAFADVGGIETLIQTLDLLNASVAASPLAQLGALGQDFDKGLGPAVDKVEELTEAEQEAAAATEQFVSTALGSLPQAGDAFSNVADAAEDEFAALVAAADPGALSANLDAMTLSILTFQQNLQALEGTGEDLDATLQFIAEAGPEEGGSLLQNLVDGTEEDRAKLETSLENLQTSTDGFSDYLSGEGEAGGAQFVEQAQQAINTGAQIVADAANATGNSAAQGISNGFAIAVSLIQVQMALVQAMLVAQGVVLTARASTVGTTAGLALGQGFGVAAPVGVTIAMGVVQAQISASGSSLAGSARGIGSQIGVSLGQGITSGIQTQVGAIAAAAAQAVNTAEQAARSAADSNSPSRLFAAVGADMGEGLVLGFEQAASALPAAAANVTFGAAGAVGSVSNSFGQILVQQTIEGGLSPGDARPIRKASRDGVSDALRTAFDVAHA